MEKIEFGRISFREKYEMTTEVRGNLFGIELRGKRHRLFAFIEAAWQTETYANICYLILGIPFAFIYGVLAIICILVLPAMIYQAAVRGGIVSPLFVISITIWLAIVRLSWTIMRYCFRLEWLIVNKMSKYRQPLYEDLNRILISYRSSLSDHDHWLGIIYAAIRVPMGLANLIIAMVSIGVVFMMLTMPFLYEHSLLKLILGATIINTFPGAMLTMFLSTPAFLIMLHGLSQLGRLQGHFAKILLDGI